MYCRSVVCINAFIRHLNIHKLRVQRALSLYGAIAHDFPVHRKIEIEKENPATAINLRHQLVPALRFSPSG